MSRSDHTGFAELARQMAVDAGDIALDRWGRATVSRKADHSVVTDVDEAIQAHLLTCIQTRFPDHAFLAEEEAEPDRPSVPAKRADYCWVIDPLDGTRNYVSGFPCFSTSIAVLQQGHPVAAVVYEHNTRQCYAAVRGVGATLNGKPARAEEPAPGSDCLLGVPSSKDELTVRVVQKWAQTRGFVLRNTGSTALHLAMVGSGALSGAFGKRTKIWDIAAGALIVEEAGGTITSPAGEPLFPYSFDSAPGADIPFLAAPPALHRKLLDSIEA